MGLGSRVAMVVDYNFKSTPKVHVDHRHRQSLREYSQEFYYTRSSVTTVSRWGGRWRQQASRGHRQDVSGSRERDELTSSVSGATIDVLGTNCQDQSNSRLRTKESVKIAMTVESSSSRITVRQWGSSQAWRLQGSPEIMPEWSGLARFR